MKETRYSSCRIQPEFKQYLLVLIVPLHSGHSPSSAFHLLLSKCTWL